MFGNLEAEMARYNIRRVEMSTSLGISRKSMDNKMNGNTFFTLKEMRAIQQILRAAANTAAIKTSETPELSLDYLFENAFAHNNTC